jgi:hypothetical protein
MYQRFEALFELSCFINPRINWPDERRFIINTFSTFFLLRVCPIFQILTSSEDGDEKAITAMGLLNTLETILTVMEDKEEVHAQLEPIILQVTIKHRVIMDLFQVWY